MVLDDGASSARASSVLRDRAVAHWPVAEVVWTCSARARASSVLVGCGWHAVPPAAESASGGEREAELREHVGLLVWAGKTGVLISLGDFVFVTRPLLDFRPSARPFARRLSVRPTPRRDVLDRRVPPDSLVRPHVCPAIEQKATYRIVVAGPSEEWAGPAQPAERA